MKIAQVSPLAGTKLRIIAEDGRSGVMDVTPYLHSTAFRPLENPVEFAKTIEARWLELSAADSPDKIR